MNKSFDKGQWTQVSTYWDLLGPPLRPTDEDIMIITDGIQTWYRSHEKSIRALILGVTPEYCNLNWPEGSDIRATDNNTGMIEHVWPGKKSQVKKASWTEMDWPKDYFNIAMCDGGLQLLDYPSSQEQLVNKLASIVKKEGIIVLRLFSLPRKQEKPAKVIQDLLSGRITSMNCLKIKLGTAMQDNSEEGVSLDAIWHYLHEQTGDWATLSKMLNWPLDHITAIDAYKGKSTRYHFMSLPDVTTLFCSTKKFSLEKIVHPTYNMGEQCPILFFKKT